MKKPSFIRGSSRALATGGVPPPTKSVYENWEQI